MSGAATLLAALALQDPAASATPAPAGPTRPSVLVITLDTTRRDFMGFHGRSPSPTPKLDELAARSIVFEDALTTAPLTLPAHASLFTGLYPGSHGVHDNSLYRLPPQARTLAEILREQGYATGAAVAAFVLDPVFGLDQGFERYQAPPRGVTSRASVRFDERRAREMVDVALADLAAMPADRPFFYWVHLFDPHSPYDPPGAAKPSPALAFDQAALTRALYQAEIAAMDQEIGRLLQALDARGLRERLIVVVASDHGEGLGEGREETHGHFLSDPTVRVPLLLCDPRLPARRVTTPASLIDVAPTLLARLGVDAGAETFDGLDLSPWIADPKEPPPDRVLALESWYVWLEYGWAPFEGCTHGALKYVRSQHEELFDRATDPAETKNLFTPEDERARGMKGRLAALREQAAALARAAPGLSEADRKALQSLGYATGGVNAELPQGDWSLLPDAYAKGASIRGFDQVSSAIEQGEFARAIELLRTLVVQEPESALFHELLGMVLVNVDPASDEEAERELKRALALDPRRPRVWFCLARIAMARRDAARIESRRLREAGDTQGAREWNRRDKLQSERLEAALRECLRLEPTYPEGLMELARLLYDEGDRALRANMNGRAAQLFGEVEVIASRLEAVLTPDEPMVKEAQSVQRIARTRRAALERQ